METLHPEGRVARGRRPPAEVCHTHGPLDDLTRPPHRHVRACAREFAPDPPGWSLIPKPLVSPLEGAGLENIS